MVNYYVKIEKKKWLCKITFSKSVMRIKVSNNYWSFIITEKANLCGSKMKDDYIHGWLIIFCSLSNAPRPRKQLRPMAQWGQGSLLKSTLRVIKWYLVYLSFTNTISFVSHKLHFLDNRFTILPQFFFQCLYGTLHWTWGGQSGFFNKGLLSHLWGVLSECIPMLKVMPSLDRLSWSDWLIKVGAEGTQCTMIDRTI